MSIHVDHSGDGACAEPLSPLGLVIIGILVFISIVLWQHGPSVGTLVLLPLLLTCPLMHFLVHRRTHGSHSGS
jgi:integral membrane sensor domain MASE1